MTQTIGGVERTAAQEMEFIVDGYPANHLSKFARDAARRALFKLMSEREHQLSVIGEYEKALKQVQVYQIEGDDRVFLMVNTHQCCAVPGNSGAASRLLMFASDQRKALSHPIIGDKS